MSVVSCCSRRLLNNIVLSNGKPQSRIAFKRSQLRLHSCQTRSFVLSAIQLQEQAVSSRFPNKDLPLKINKIDDISWDETADIVVVGFGGAGAVSSIQARELGADVIAIDRFGSGGTTAYSGGVVYAGGTKFQKDSGYPDTAEEMYMYLDTEGCPVKPETLRRFCNGSSSDIEWISGLGVPFGGNAFEGKTSFPPNDHFLYYSGNEKMPNFTAKAKPAPRGHRTAVNGFGGGTYFAKLRDAALSRDVKLLTHTVAQRLVVDADNRVVGIEVNSLPQKLWKKHNSFYKIVHPWVPFNYARINRAMAGAAKMEERFAGRKFIRARRGVILTTGGFNRNEPLVKKYRPALAKYYDRLLPLGSIGDNGSGLTMGESVGGKTDKMANISVSRTLVPPEAFAHGMLVNKAGHRFVNEAAYAFFVGGDILEQPDGVAWVILNSKDFWRGVYKSFFPGGTFLLWGAPALMNIFMGGTRRGKTLEKLSRKVGLDPAGVAKQAVEYDATAEVSGADAWGKSTALCKPLGKGPYYAVNMSLGNKFAPVQSITMGGLVVDEDTGNVKRGDDGGLIQGLYAAGRVAVGICSGGFVSGMSLADTIFSGRRAARAALARDSKHV